MEPASFAIGQRVYDRDDDNPNPAIVANTPPIPANDWEVYGGPETVADDNPDYPDDAPIVIVFFEDELPEDTDWDRTRYVPITDLNEIDAFYYTFPEPRLKPVDTDGEHDEDTTEEESSLDPELASLRDRLTERGIAVEPAENGACLVYRKLGVTYRIHPERVEGDGPHREQLEQLLG